MNALAGILLLPNSSKKGGKKEKERIFIFGSQTYRVDSQIRFQFHREFIFGCILFTDHFMLHLCSFVIFLIKKFELVKLSLLFIYLFR